MVSFSNRRNRANVVQTGLATAFYFSGCESRIRLTNSVCLPLPFSAERAKSPLASKKGIGGKDAAAKGRSTAPKSLSSRAIAKEIGKEISDGVETANRIEGNPSSIGVGLGSKDDANSVNHPSAPGGNKRVKWSKSVADKDQQSKATAGASAVKNANGTSGTNCSDRNFDDEEGDDETLRLDADRQMNASFEEGIGGLVRASSSGSNTSLRGQNDIEKTSSSIAPSLTAPSPRQKQSFAPHGILRQQVKCLCERGIVIVVVT